MTGSWYWRPPPPDASRDFGNAAAFALDADLRTLARETGQNSTDELLEGSPTVEMRFSVIELTGGDKDSFLQSLDFSSDVLPHLQAAAGADQKVSRAVELGLRRLDEEDGLLLIRVADFHASGLTGPERDTGRFMAVARNSLDSQKASASAGGSFGLGKFTMWALSSFGLVLMNSHLSDDVDGKFHSRLIGRLELPWHELDHAQAYAGPAWFGELDDEMVANSIWDDDALVNSLHLDRPLDVPGTSFLIVAAYDPSQTAETPLEMADELSNALAESFWPAMVEIPETGAPRLKALVEVFKGHERVEERLVDPSEHQGPLVAALNRYYADDLSDELRDPGDVVCRTVPLSVPARLHAAGDVVEHDALAHDAKLLVAYAGGDELEPNRQVRLRGSRLVITDERVSGLPLGSRPFHAVLLAGTASGDDDDGRAAERFLRAAEPPKHDKWSPTSDIGALYKRGGRASLKNFLAQVKAEIILAVAGAPPKTSDGPDVLKRLLRLKHVSEPRPKVPVIDSLDGEPDEEGVWRLRAVARIPQGAPRQSFKPVLLFVGNSGPGVAVSWSEITPGVRCDVLDGFVIPRPGARTFTFEGVAERSEQPTTGHLATVEIAVRDAREEP